MLTAAHEPLVRAQALNHVSPFFADVVWRGLSTAHVRAGPRRPRRPRHAARAVAADQPVVVSRSRCAATQDAAGLREVRPDVPGRSVAEAGRRVRSAAASRSTCAVLPCGHYSTGAAPFKFLDGWYLGQVSCAGTCRSTALQSKSSGLSERSRSYWIRCEPLTVHGTEPSLAHRRLEPSSEPRAVSLAGVHRLGDRDRIGQQQPHRGSRDDRGEQPDDADEAEQPTRTKRR